MEYPIVSIIIPFYCDPYVPHAIQSALDQTYPNKEIIIISDGSHSYNELLIPYLQHPDVHFIEKHNGGTASALNVGIRSARGEYIAWLSSDDVFYPHKLERQLSYMLPRQARISFSDFDVIDGNGSLTAQWVTPKYPDVFSFYKAFQSYNPINGCTVVASKSLLVELGLFDEALPYSHDYDMWFRVIIHDIDFHYVNESLIQYRIHSSMGTKQHYPVILEEAEATRRRWSPHVDALIARMLRTYG